VTQGGSIFFGIGLPELLIIVIFFAILAAVVIGVILLIRRSADSAAKDRRFVFCTKCGTQNDGSASHCVRCGNPLLYPQQFGTGAVVPNYLAQAILVTIFCCVPFGIPAIVFAAQVNGKLAAGDYTGALETSKKAKMWCWIAFGAGFAFVIISIAFAIIGAMNRGRFY
jgi:ribosomal protein L40E